MKPRRWAPVPEPHCDVRAQIAALVDQRHPKIAVFLVPENREDIPELPASIMRCDRTEGTLLTTDKTRLEIFSRVADDQTMAWILGYPQDKWTAMRTRNGVPVVVQARSPSGAVITEALVSPNKIASTRKVFAAHGDICVVSLGDSILRRLSLRAASLAASGA